jgi:hypothetical protein
VRLILRDTCFPSCIFSVSPKCFGILCRDDIARASSGRGMLIPPQQNKLPGGDLD